MEATIASIQNPVTWFLVGVAGCLLEIVLLIWLDDTVADVPDYYQNLEDKSSCWIRLHSRNSSSLEILALVRAETSAGASINLWKKLGDCVIQIICC